MNIMLLLISLVLAAQTWSQTFNPSASELTMEEAQELFQDLKGENEKMKTHSECFQRAHMWSLRSDYLKQIKTEKVFIFLTRKFQMGIQVNSRFKRPITWWFHVAPAVRVNGDLVVMDATFADSALPVQNWAQSLMKNPEECLELTNYQDYADDRNFTNRQQCYFTATPQYVYAPIDLGLGEVKGVMTYAPKTEFPDQWLTHTLEWALDSYQWKHRKEVRRSLKF